MYEQRVVGGVRAGTPVLSPGHVWLAGAGPGDPGLLTRDAFAGLSQADVVVHDALVDHRVLALAGPQARLEFAGKRGDGRRPSSATSRTAWSSSHRADTGGCGPRGAVRGCSGQ